MDAGDAPRKRPGLTLAVWVSLILGVYAVIAVASILGLATGAFAGALGGIIAVAVLTHRPPARTRRVAKVALGLNAIAVAAFLAVIIAIVILALY